MGSEHSAIKTEIPTKLCVIMQQQYHTSKTWGGTKALKCNQLTKIIWSWCETRSIWLTAAFIPGIENVDADTASRKFNENTEWKLNPNIFASIANKFGWPEIDLFASSENKQIKNFVS